MNLHFLTPQKITWEPFFVIFFEDGGRAFLNHFSYLKKRKDRGGVGEGGLTKGGGGTGSKLPLG